MSHPPHPFFEVVCGCRREQVYGGANGSFKEGADHAVIEFEVADNWLDPYPSAEACSGFPALVEGIAFLGTTGNQDLRVPTSLRPQ